MKIFNRVIPFFLATALSAVAGSFHDSFKGELVAVKAGAVTAFDDKALASVKYFAVYFSAGSSGPCKRFTPQLVKWYEQNKPKHPEFELILASGDRDAKGMEAYMLEDKLPWPAIKFDKLAQIPTVAKLEGEGIPCLVFVDSTGKVLSHSYEKGTYLGPAKVMNDIDALLGTGASSGGVGRNRSSSGSGSDAASRNASTFNDFFKKKPAQ
jgi:nucleoredoxin